MRTLGVLQVDEYSLKERFEMKYLWCKHNVFLVFRIACICELPQDITMFMWTTIANFLSQVADRPMSSPSCVDRAGHVLVYRTMYSNDVAPCSQKKVPSRRVSM